MKKFKDMSYYLDEGIAAEGTAWRSSEPLKVTAPSPLPFAVYLGIVVAVGLVVGAMVASIGES
jgi:hypothetical protein